MGESGTYGYGLITLVLSTYLSFRCSFTCLSRAKYQLRIRYAFVGNKNSCDYTFLVTLVSVRPFPYLIYVQWTFYFQVLHVSCYKWFFRYLYVYIRFITKKFDLLFYFDLMYILTVLTFEDPETFNLSRSGSVMTWLEMSPKLSYRIRPVGRRKCSVKNSFSMQWGRIYNPSRKKAGSPKNSYRSASLHFNVCILNICICLVMIYSFHIDLTTFSLSRDSILAVCLIVDS